MKIYWLLKKVAVQEQYVLPKTQSRIEHPVSNLLPLTIFAKSSILDLIQGSECASETTSLQATSHEQYSRFKRLLTSSWKKLNILKEEFFSRIDFL